MPRKTKTAVAKPVKQVPPTTRGKVDWHQVDALARKHPGEWVEVDEPLTSGVSTMIRRGGVRAIDPEVYEVTTRSNSDGRTKTFYLKYVGDEGA